MKRIFAIIGCVSIFFALSCTREKLVQDEPIVKAKTYITLTADNTKTTVGELSEGVRAVYWANGDKVAVNGVVSEPLSELPANCASATFEFNSLVEPPFNAVYPETNWKDEFSVTLPQQAKSGILPLVGYGNAESMSVKPITAVIKLSVKKYSGENPDLDKIVSVAISSEDTQLSGDFAVDFQTGELTPYLNPVEQDRIVTIRPNLTLTDAAQDLFIPVPAGSYNFKVRLTDVQGHFMEISTTSPKTFVAGRIKAFPEIEFVPTGTAIDVVISSPADLIKFAEDWNSGVFEGKEPIVHVSTDLVFDAASSADFSATGGIGKADDGNGGTNYFNGLFEGNGCTVHGYTGSEPFFAYTGSAGIIQNLNFADDCIVTVTSPATITQHGIIVGRHKGKLDHCIIDGDLVIGNIENVSSANQYYGAFVGRNYGGSIKDCSMQGNIICSQNGVTLTGNYAYIGGITGYLTDYGTIDNTFFLGNITISDGTEYGGISSSAKTYFNIGGIAGGGDKGSITGCISSDPHNPASFDVRGNFIPCVAGIAGWVAEKITISNSYNAADISIVSNGARANTTPCRIGGIAGRSLGSIETCQNYGALATRCQSTTVWGGGIVGDAAGQVIDCNNFEHGTLTRTNQADGGQSNRYIGMGGIVGGAAAALTVERCSNMAAVLSNTPTTATNATIDLGGILGYAQKFAVTLKDCINDGAVKSSDTENRNAYARISVGGVAGCLNGAESKVIGCTNSALAHAENTLGAETSGGINDRRTYVGGIVGIMADQSASAINGLAGLEIVSCTNTGQVWSQNYNNRTTLIGAPFGGGIVGVIVGTDESPALVKECIANSAKAITNYRGYVGGVAAYAGNASLESNEVSGEVSGNKSGIGNGGIVSWAVGTSLKGCTFKGTIKTVKNIGGLAYLLDSGSSIDACSVDGATITKGTDATATEAAVLVSKAADGTVIKDCGIKGTLDGAAITLESNLITTDDGATVSGTYILD